MPRQLSRVYPGGLLGYRDIIPLGVLLRQLPSFQEEI